MKIRMLKNAKGSENGIKVKEFIEGRSYDIHNDLGRVFVEEMRVAVLAHVVNLPEIFEIPEKPLFEVPEKALTGKPKSWIGLQVRPIAGGDAVTIKRMVRGGKAFLSDGQVIHYSQIKREWEIADDD